MSERYDLLDRAALSQVFKDPRTLLAFDNLQRTLLRLQDEQTPVLFANLPAAADSMGTRRFILDGSVTLAAGIGTVAAGGGVNFLPVFSDETNWIVG